MASRQGYNVTGNWSGEHILLQQTEWSDVPDDTEWDLPGLSTEPLEISLPVTEREAYRIKRALLRYELFCALFYLGPDGYFDTRHHPHRYHQESDLHRQHANREDQIGFLNEYVNPWEVGELAVITHFMYDLVRYVHDRKTPVLFRPLSCRFERHTDSDIQLGMPTSTHTSLCAAVRSVMLPMSARNIGIFPETNMKFMMRWLKNSTTTWSGSQAKV